MLRVYTCIVQEHDFRLVIVAATIGLLACFTAFSTLTVAMVAMAAIILSISFALVPFDRRLARQADEEAQRIAAFAAGSIEGLVVTDGERVVDANRSFLRLSGYATSSGLPERLEDLFPGLNPARMPAGLNAAATECRLVDADGREHDVELLLRPLNWRGAERRVLAVRAISWRKEAVARIARLAHHDTLTSLPRRAKSAAAAPPVSFVPTQPNLTPAADHYRLLWEAEGVRIVAALEEVTGIAFPVTPIEVMIGNSPPMMAYDRRTMRLRPGRSDDYRLGTLVHELGHRLAMELPHTAELDDHRLLYLFLYDVWTDLYGQEFADRMVRIERRIPGPYDYDAAWSWALAMTREQRQARLRALLRPDRRSVI